MREYDINLIPDDLLKREALLQRMWTWLYVSGGVLAFLITVSLLIKIMNNHSMKEITVLTAEGESVSGDMIQFREMQAMEHELIKMRNIAGHLSQKGPVVGIFSSIDRAINHNIVLTHIEILSQYAGMQNGANNDGTANSGYFNNAAHVKAPGGKDNVLIMRGMSRSNSGLAAMLSKLSDNDVYSSVNLKYARSGDVEDAMPVSFEIECMLNKTIPVRD